MKEDKNRGSLAIEGDSRAEKKSGGKRRENRGRFF